MDGLGPVRRAVGRGELRDGGRGDRVPAASSVRPGRAAAHPAVEPAHHGRAAVRGERAVGRLLALHLPAYVLPFWKSLAVMAVLKLCVAAFGTFLLGRALGMRFGGALLAGAVFPSGRSSSSGSRGRSRTSSRCCRGCSCSASSSYGGLRRSWARARGGGGSHVPRRAPGDVLPRARDHGRLLRIPAGARRGRAAAAAATLLTRPAVAFALAVAAAPRSPR